jgi:glycosyltransferase involved in cell wall biosynthesis
MAERKLVDMFLPVSQAIAEATQLTKHQVPYQVIPNFIPNNVDIVSDRAHPFLEQLPQEDFLLFIGDIVPDKGVDILFQAYSEMESQVPLVLIGRLGPNLPVCPPNVRILENWPHAAIMSAWSRCTIALMPSICLDACPTVTMEAMAMGRPVVASRIGGLSDLVIDGETGLLVAPGSPQELRKAIQCLLDDPVQREHMGKMAKQRVVEFQAKSVVSRIEQVYHEVLGL